MDQPEQYISYGSSGGGRNQRSLRQDAFMAVGVKIDFDHTDVDVLVIHTNGTIEETIKYLSLELRGMLRT